MDQAENLRRLVQQQQQTPFLTGTISPPAQTAYSTRIVAVTSGKGGVGKTNLT